MRDAFLLDPDLVFLNHGSFGACPREVFDAYRHWQLELERNPVEFLGRRSAALLHAARQTLAESIGATAADLVFVPNATTGVNTVARSLQLQPGDEIVSTDHEYGACEAAFHFVCAERGAHWRPVVLPLPFDVESDDAAVQRLLGALSPRTRLLYLSHITSGTALTLPVAALCAEARKRGIATLIDGAHAPGQIDLNLQAIGADFYVGNCHKWMCAPKGAAFLHARPERHAELHAAVLSWGYAAGDGGHSGLLAKHGDYTGSTLLERRLQWQGTRDIAAFLAVPAAIEFQQRHAWPTLRQRCHAIAIETRDRVLSRNGLQPIAPDNSHAQMVPIPVRTTDGEALRRWLFEQHRIEVPVTRHGEHHFVRVSVQAYNTQADVDVLVRALAEAGV